ncbi:MAG: hypothetical protein ABT940_09665 [Alphaproteobacteria bacterium]
MKSAAIIHDSKAVVPALWIGSALARIGKGLILPACLLCLGLMGCNKTVAGYPASEEGFMLSDLRLSPDGRTVVFQYRDTSADKRPDLSWRRNCQGLGILEWETGKLTRIPNPPDKQLRDASFSYDGKRLIAAMGNICSDPSKIVEVDPVTFQVRVLYENHEKIGVFWPVLQPGTDNILFVPFGWGSTFHHFSLFNPKDGSTKIILDKKDGFVSEVTRPFFISQEEVIFQARGPADRDFRKKVVELTGSTSAELISYRLRFGELPQFLFPKIEALRKNDVLSESENEFSRVVGSQDGKTIIAIGFSATNKYNERKQFNYELFEIRGGVPHQLTNLRSHLAYPVISYDGSTVAFGSDPSRRYAWDLFILNLKTGTITPTGLLKRITGNPDFKLIPND